jgi:hypothetical protein
MRAYALDTASALYRSGTLSLPQAARQAGVSPARIQHHAARAAN